MWAYNSNTKEYERPVAECLILRPTFTKDKEHVSLVVVSATLKLARSKILGLKDLNKSIKENKTKKAKLQLIHTKNYELYVEKRQVRKETTIISMQIMHIIFYNK